MQVSEAMGGPVDTCAADATISQVAKRMSDEDHGALPVTSNGELIGIITERDIMRVVANHADPDETKVREVMTPDPDFLAPDVSIEDAASWMLAAGYRHLPVVDKGKVLGMVSVKDVMWALTGGVEGGGRRVDHGTNS
jgi:CBS domain-containing protein